MINTQDKKVPLDRLVLDPNNYRLADEKEERDIPDSHAEDFEEATLKRLEHQRLGELKDSILHNGFLEMERIVVRLLNTEENLNRNEEDRKFIVVEGNRRTAALKSIRKTASSNILSRELLDKFDSLNVILIEGDADQLRAYSATLMGIRHVSGPKKWDGFQSAKLINDLWSDGKSFSEIGDILGITSREVGRRFRGYKAFQQMRLDPSYNQKVEPRHYGLLLEFLASSKQGKSWLQWDDSDYEFKNSNNLEIVYSAITHDESGNIEIRNPADARKFVSLLSNETYRPEIEAGESIHDMPDPNELKESGKLKRITSFILFVEKNNFESEEQEKLAELYEALALKVGAQDD